MDRDSPPEGGKWNETMSSRMRRRLLMGWPDEPSRENRFPAGLASAR